MYIENRIANPLHPTNSKIHETLKKEGNRKLLGGLEPDQNAPTLLPNLLSSTITPSGELVHSKKDLQKSNIS